MKKVHFVTGLPRSGSTMLAAILRQNPDIEAGMSTGVCGAISSFIEIASQGEMNKLINLETRNSVARSMFEAFMDAHEEPVVFDTSRQWTAMMDLGLFFRSDAKFIATVRNPGWVMDSLERKIQSNPTDRSKLMSRQVTQKTRAQNAFSSNGIVGNAIENLSSALFSEHAERLLVLDYDFLCAQPEVALKEIYSFCDLPAFDHDFGNLDYKAEQFDELLSTPNLHTVSGPVEVKERTSILPPALFASLQQYDVWSHAAKSSKARFLLDE